MMNTDNRRGLAGVVVAGLALSLTGGTAIALSSSDAPQASSAQSQQASLTKAEKKVVKKIALKMAAKQVTKMAPNLSVAKAKSADTATSATSAQNAVHATTADMATNAQNAANAAKVGGLDVKKINTVIAPGGPNVVLIDSDGFTLTASCAAGVVDVVAASSVPGGRLRSADIDNNETVSTQGSNDLSAAGFSIHVPGGDGRGSLTMEFVSASGQVINAWIGYRNDAPGCAYFGNYMVG